MVDGGLLVAVRLTPKGGRDAIDGAARLSDGTEVVKARVRRAPENGEANAALLSLLAGALDVPVSSVWLAAGATSRLKQVRIAGEGRALAARLDKLIGTDGT
jgi:uncharacterized protein YggU (UPF0235/DUF167 family)